MILKFGSITAFLILAGMDGFLGARADAVVEQRADSADVEAHRIVGQMTLDEKISLLHGSTGGSASRALGNDVNGAGFVPGIVRLGVPALHETDAPLGVVGAGLDPDGPKATAFPSGLALASTFDPGLAYRMGATVGAEARAKGFNVLLGGGVDLARDPRNGRNFEYLGEDPLLAGILAGAEIRGVQDQHVMSTVKHFVVNDNETNRKTLNAVIDPAALRESDLLAFEIAIERGRPGAVMCAYNKVNGAYACGNDELLNGVLKRDWRYPGFVMSDWGAVHSTDYALRGLDQQSGEQIDDKIWFGAPLESAVRDGTIPQARIDDMARRIVRSMLATQIGDDPPKLTAIDYAGHAKTALDLARKGIVLLKNEGDILPLPRHVKRIAVIGGDAQFGVLSGGGSSQVTPSDHGTFDTLVGGQNELADLRKEVWIRSAPMKALQSALGDAEILYDPGIYPADAAALARRADIAIIFASQHQFEGADVPDLTLPRGQDAVIEAVAKANPETVVVLETGNPVSMPWAGRVPGIVEAWYPGQEGGQAIADILTGAVNPSGHLPVTFPVDDEQTVRPTLPNLGADTHADVAIDYSEGADVGYRWYAREGRKALFSFGFGLSYTRFALSGLKVEGGSSITVSFTVKNIGARAGATVPQAYLSSAAGQPLLRLIGFQRVELKPGETHRVSMVADPRLLARFDASGHRWRIAGGRYKVFIGQSSASNEVSGQVELAARTLPAGWHPDGAER